MNAFKRDILAVAEDWVRHSVVHSALYKAVEGGADTNEYDTIQCQILNDAGGEYTKLTGEEWRKYTLDMYEQVCNYIDEELDAVMNGTVEYKINLFAHLYAKENLASILRRRYDALVTIPVQEAKVLGADLKKLFQDIDIPSDWREGIDEMDDDEEGLLEILQLSNEEKKNINSRPWIATVKWGCENMFEAEPYIMEYNTSSPFALLLSTFDFEDPEGYETDMDDLI